MSPFDRLLRIMLQPWVAVSYLSFTVLSFLYLDKPIAYFLHGLEIKTRVPLIYWITKLGQGAVYMALFFILAVFFRYMRRNKEFETRSWFLLLCVLVPNIICGILKVLLGRARPELWFDSQLFGFYGMHFNASFWSFPSGHTTTIAGLVFGLSIVFPRYFYAFIVSGLVVISTRVLLTDHYLSDVMATGYITLLEVGMLLVLLRRKAWLRSVYRTVHCVAQETA